MAVVGDRWQVSGGEWRVASGDGPPTTCHLPPSTIYSHGGSIERRRYAAGKLRFEIGVEVVVCEMREVCAFGTNGSGDAEGFGNAQVCRMLRAKQRIDHEDLGAAQKSERLRRYGLGIRDVGQRSDSIREHRHLAVWNGHGGDFRVANEKGVVRLDDMGLTLGLGRSGQRPS